MAEWLRRSLRREMRLARGDCTLCGRRPYKRWYLCMTCWLEVFRG